MPLFFHPSTHRFCGGGIFIFIHPYMDGNGRIGRFLMNTMLASGGYPWRYLLCWGSDHRSDGCAAYIPLSFDPGEAFQFDWSYEQFKLGGVNIKIKIPSFGSVTAGCRFASRGGSTTT